ncbi:MAG: universal stress protein [Chloroflexota bacterium]
MDLYRNILVPLDGSELSERALEPAYRIARAMAALPTEEPESSPVKLILLQSSSPANLVAADPYLYDELVRMVVDESQVYLNKVATRFEDSPVVVETVSVTGAAAESIVRYAEDHHIDLIVLSSHGRTGSSRWVYGSVAEKVLHHAPCAVAIIRAQTKRDMFQNRSILVPLDGSTLAEQALEPAMALARSVGSDVVLLRVVPSPEPLPEGLVTPGAITAEQRQMVEQSEREEAEAYLQKIYNQLPTAHLFFDVAVTSGYVADAIVDYATAHNTDLIVMSSHGRSGISRWLYGSVAEKVLRGADCATLIVRSTTE